jgi:hypothetical protein
MSFQHRAFPSARVINCNWRIFIVTCTRPGFRLSNGWTLVRPRSRPSGLRIVSRVTASVVRSIGPWFREDITGQKDDDDRMNQVQRQTGERSSLNSTFFLSWFVSVHSFSRLCGALFCGTCSRYRTDLDKFGMTQVRCCLRCFGAVQSMTMSNSLSLWEEPGTLPPPAERSWIGSPLGLSRREVDPATKSTEPSSAGSSISVNSSATTHNPNASKYERSLATSDDDADDDDDSSDVDTDESDREYARDMQEMMGRNGIGQSVYRK